jgi:hypothetical protein
LVLEAANAIPAQMAQNVCDSNRKYLLYLLEAKRDGTNLAHTV